MFKKLTISLLALSMLLTGISLKPTAITATEKQTLNIAVVTTDENNDLYKTLVANYNGIQKVSTIDAALELNTDDDANNDVKGMMVLADTYPDQLTVLTNEQSQAIKDHNIRLYIEYPDNNATLGISGYSGTGVMGSSRAVVTDEDSMNMELYSLLYVNGAQFVKKAFDANKAGTADNNVWMVSAKVAGYDVGEYALTNTSPFVLLEESNNVLIATTKFSQWISARYAPYERYQEFWASVLTWLTGSSTRVSNMKWELAVKAAHAENAVLTTDDYLNAVINNSDWFFNSGFLLSDTDAEAYKSKGAYGSSTYTLNPDSTGDGSNGVIESFSSGAQFYTDGSQKIRFLRRADCTGETAGALAMAYYSTGDERYKEAAYNLVDWLFNESSLTNGARADVNSPQYGLLDWDDASNTPEQYYGDDNAKAILGLIEAIAVLGEDGEQFQQRLLESIIANFRTSGVYGFRGNNISASALEANGWEAYYNGSIVNYASHFESMLWACYLWAYEQTGWQPLLERTKIGIEMMMKAYENNQWKWTNGMQQERAKMIVSLAWLVKLEPTEKHEEWLHTMVNDIMMFQQENGGIQERLGTGTGAYGSYKSNNSYGGSEAPVIQNNGDPCVDNLYTQGFAMLGLNEAANATSNAEYKAEYTNYFNKLTDFAVKTQQVSDTYSQYDGVWFRAFDYDKWETYGSDGDHEWGVWTTETGWTQAWLSSGISMRIKNTSIWDLSSTMDLKDDFDVVKDIMLASVIVNDGNVAMNKTVSDNNPNADGALAVDGTLDTYYESTADEDTPEIIIDLEGRYNLSEIAVVPYYEDSRSSVFNVYVSTDKEVWNKVGEQSSDSANTKNGYTFTLEDNNTRYIKVESISDSIGNTFIVNEIRAFGDKISSDLEDTIISAELKDTDGYTKASIEVLNIAIADAREVLANESASESEINNAIAVIEDAIDRLTLISANYVITYSPSLGKEGSNGSVSLVDNVYGALTGSQYFNNGTWMGIEGKDLTITVDMQEVKFFDSLSLGFLEEWEWGIRYPEYVTFATSIDNVTYTDFDTVNWNKEFTAGPSTKDTMTTADKEVAARYIKIFIKNAGKIPEGHRAAGASSWFFFDELTINYVEGTGALQMLVDECASIDKTLYTPESVAVYEEALQEAKDVLNDSNATSVEVYDATNALSSAISALEYIDKTPTAKYSYSVGSVSDYGAGILDGVVGSLAMSSNGIQAFPNGTWIGKNNGTARGNEFVIDVDFKETKTFNKLSLGFLKEGNGWGIEYPTSVKYEVSNDGINYEEYDTIDMSEVTASEFREIYRATTDVKKVSVRYVRITIVDKSEWFFFDELLAEMDKTELQELINSIKDTDLSLYTSSSKKVFNDALSNAENVIAKEATAEEIINAIDSLENAKKGLTTKEYVITYIPSLTSGDGKLMDGVYGALSGSQYFANGTWAGMQNNNVSITVDLRETTPIKQMTMGFLKESQWGINFPASVTFSVSKDGVYYDKYYTNDFSGAPSDASTMYRVESDVKEVEARYIRIDVVRNGEWFFFDEFTFDRVVLKDALEQSIIEAESVDTSLYTNASLDTLEEAIEKAKEELVDDNATQEEVDAACEALEEAKSNLTTKEVVITYSPNITRGDGKIMDGVLGTLDLNNGQAFNNETWAGQQNSNLQIDIDLREVKRFDNVTLGVLSEKSSTGVNWGIEYPASVKFEISMDGETYEEYYTKDMSSITPASYKEIYKIVSDSKEVSARYVRISIERKSEWVFFDEFTYHEVADKSVLESLVNELDNLDTTPYTQSSINALDEVLESAKTVLADKEATNEEVEEMFDALTDAKTNLTTKEVVITYTPNLSNGGKNGIMNIMDGVNGTFATDPNGRIFASGEWAGQQNSNLQIDIDLREIKEFDQFSLGFLHESAMGIYYPDSVTFEVSTDKETYVEMGTVDLSDITVESSAEIYKAVVAKADTQARYVRITIQRNNSKEWFFFDEFIVSDVDTSTLQTLVDQYSDIDESDYTTNSYAIYETSVNKAKEILADETSTQNDVDNAINEVEETYAALVNIVSLSKVVDELKDTDTSKYTDESVEAFEKALADAQDALVDGTAEEVEAFEKVLADAYNALKEKQTSSEGGSTPEEPGTGDTTNVGGLLTMMIAALGVLLISRRKRA